MQSQECRKCAAGTYSLGTGVAFDEWDGLPTGFITYGETTNGGDSHTDCSKLVFTVPHSFSFKSLYFFSFVST